LRGRKSKRKTEGDANAEGKTWTDRESTKIRRTGSVIITRILEGKEREEGARF